MTEIEAFQPINLNQPNQKYYSYATNIHGRNVKAGWWTDIKSGESTLHTRNRAELLMLVVSEVAEAADGIEGNLYDDKLPHLPMFDVELADVAIRLFDMIGAEESAQSYPTGTYEVTEAIDAVGDRLESESCLWSEILMEIVRESARAMEHLRKSRNAEYYNSLWTTLATTFAAAALWDIDLFAVIDEKLAFNANRADHKIENRKRDDGKKF